MTPWTVACQTPRSVEFSRLEYWSGLPFSSPGESSQPRNWTQVSRIAGELFTVWTTRKAQDYWVGSLSLLPWIFLTSGSPAFLVDSLPAELPGKPKLCSLRLELRTFTLWDRSAACCAKKAEKCLMMYKHGLSPPGSFVHGILLRILEWVAIPFSREFSQPKDQTWVCSTASRLYFLSPQGRTL